MRLKIALRLSSSCGNTTYWLSCVDRAASAETNAQQKNTSAAKLRKDLWVHVV